MNLTSIEIFVWYLADDLKREFLDSVELHGALEDSVLFWPGDGPPVLVPAVLGLFPPGLTHVTLATLNVLDEVHEPHLTLA